MCNYSQFLKLNLLLPPCRLNADEHIQMVTALALQLIQCVVKLPQTPEPDKTGEEEPPDDTAKCKKDKYGRPKRKSDPVRYLCYCYVSIGTWGGI